MRDFLITSVHNVNEDDYNEGELKEVNSYSLDSRIKAYNYRDAISDYLQNTLGYNLDFKNCEVENDSIYTSCLVDADNMQPTNSEVEQWKQGKKKLYSNNIMLLVSEVVSVKLD